MLSQALVDNQVVSDEVALLETFRGAYGITEEMHQKLLNLAIQEPVYSENVKTYLESLEAIIFDGVITDDEDAMLDTLKISQH